ncbi:nascent polypeptide-associated complex subunit alpha, muscle-specific form-like [Schistocerca cancellata]|uniref:nascent polypeptide-associated complex subunit alpha, muscle-specific form-like n=1 Tax=Schistocerca cancellata TaxID=274614 RepID=UPI00211886E7|nr:nascent polypeptide-associated complex subunit alpha, muscle-specific form-like [Schistocerca cancellata]
MNKLAHGGPYPGREADEAAIFALCKIQTAAALPHTRQQVLGVPPRAPPVTSHLLAVPAAAASAGVAPLVSTTQEVDVPPVAPLAPETQEEPVAALAVATEMEDVDLPDANLAEAIAESERRDTDPDAARAPRKRRAMTNDDSDTPSQTSDAARPRKKAPRASRTSTTESGTTIAGSSRSTAKQKPTKTTRRSTRPPAASRHPDEDGFVAPPRRHTARAAALQQPTPLPTANAFASASVDALDDGAAPPAPAQKKPFAAATKGGPSASTARPSAQAEGETQQPTAPSTASPVGVATPAPSQSARVAAPRRRRRRAGRATPAVAQRTAANTLPQQRTAPRAVPQPRSTADAPQQPSTSDRPQQAAPVVEAAPEAPTAPLAADAAELRSLLRSLTRTLDMAMDYSTDASLDDDATRPSTSQFRRKRSDPGPGLPHVAPTEDGFLRPPKKKQAKTKAPAAAPVVPVSNRFDVIDDGEKENSPGCYEVNRTDLTGSQGGMSPSSRLLLLNAIAGLTGRDRRKYEKKLERAWKEPPILPKGDRTAPSARLIKAKSKKSPKRNKVKPGSPVKKRKTTSRKTVAARRPEVADAAGSAAPEPTAPANTKADRATCSGGQQGQVAAEQSACAVTASAPPEAAGRLRPEVNAQKHEGAEASARGRRKETDTAGAGSPPRGNAGAEEPRSVAEVCAEGSERCGSSAEIATQEIDDEGFQLALFILMNKLAHGGPYPGREADEAAIFALCKIQTAAALPHTRQQVLGVPPRAPPVTSHLLAVPAAAASAGVAPLVSTTQEVDVPPVAPLAPETQEEPVAALAVATEMEDVDLPDANLAEAIAESERRDTDPDAARAPRKRRAMTNDDSDTPSQTSDAARPRKKAPRASRTSTTESGTTIAGSSRSTAKQKPTKTTRRSTRPPAASRHPDEDGFVAPPRRHTARAAALQQPTPLPTANAFASASVDALDDGAAPPAPAQKKPFAAATKGGPSASTARPSAQAEGETQQPTAPSTASPVGVATPAPSQSARVAAPRRRRRRAGRATPAVAQRTAANTLPQQRTAPRAVPQPRSTADAPQQPSTSDRPQQAAPVVEAAAEAPTAPLAADAAELRSLLRSLSQLLEQLPADHENMTTQRDPDDEMDYSTDPPREDCATGAPQRVLQRKRSAVTSASDDQHTSGTSDAGFKKPPPKKRAAPRRRTPVAPVPTANPYDALADGADSEDADEPPPATADDATRRSGPKLPPIVIDYPDDYMTLRDWLQGNLKNAFTAKHCGEDRLKLTVATTEDYVAVMDMVGARGIPNYTFPTVRPKVLKVAMRGIPLKMKADAFKDGLITMGFAPTATTRMKMPASRRQRGLPPLRETSRSDGRQLRRRAAPPPATPSRQPAQRRLLAARADLGYADVLQGRTTPPPAPAVQPPRRPDDGPAPPAAADDFIAVLKEVQATLVAVSAALAQLPAAITAAVHAALRSFPTATASTSTGHGSQP